MTFALAGTIALVSTPAPRPPAPPGQGPEFGSSSPIGLVVILLFFVAVGLLVRSMTKHLKRVPASFDEPDKPTDEPGQAGESEPTGEPRAAGKPAQTGEPESRTGFGHGRDTPPG